ncbi:hypothetical protein FRC11_011374, partial [Ceratobasidium sp. 423]
MFEFKQRPHLISTSSALRNSDIKALRQRVLTLFPDSKGKMDINVLVPHGVTHCRFDSRVTGDGIIYSSAENEPLWFSIGKKGLAEPDLIPTGKSFTRNYYVIQAQTQGVIPLRRQVILISPSLADGADLTASCVTPSCILPSLTQGQLVSIAQYQSTTPLAIGSMAIKGSDLEYDINKRRKAVVMLHAAEDAVWARGGEQEAPEGKPPSTTAAPVTGQIGNVGRSAKDKRPDHKTQVNDDTKAGSVSDRVPTALEIEKALRKTALYALARLDVSSLPLAASNFYSSHILPSRPARPILRSLDESKQPIDPNIFLSHPDIKHTPRKKLAPFLKAFEKYRILELKYVRGELLVFSMDTKHPALAMAVEWSWETIGDKEKKIKSRRESTTHGSTGGIVVEEIWFPDSRTAGFFEACRENALHYTHSSLSSFLAEYVTTHNLRHPDDPELVVLDEALSRALLWEGEPTKGYVQEDELVNRLSGNMMGMWRVDRAGDFRAMPPQPVNVQTKIRKWQKHVTLITGFEPYGIDPKALSKRLRKWCASGVSGKPEQLEVMVQGNQVQAVTSLLLELGLPKKWVTISGNKEMGVRLGAGAAQSPPGSRGTPKPWSIFRRFKNYQGSQRRTPNGLRRSLYLLNMQLVFQIDPVVLTKRKRNKNGKKNSRGNGGRGRGSGRGRGRGRGRGSGRGDEKTKRRPNWSGNRDENGTRNEDGKAAGAGLGIGTEKGPGPRNGKGTERRKGKNRKPNR